MKIYVLKTHALKIVLFKIAYFTRKVKKLKVVEVRLLELKKVQYLHGLSMGLLPSLPLPSSRYLLRFSAGLAS